MDSKANVTVDPWCPDKNPDTAPWNVSDLRNRTKFDNEKNQLPLFVCLYYYVFEMDDILDLAGAIVKISGCILGVISSILAIIVFTRPEFRVVSFSYHCVINIADLCNSL